MANRDIHCSSCSTYVGTIRDAKLMKEMAHLCNRCEETRKTVEAQLRLLMAQHQRGGVSDIFGDTFGDIFGGKR